MLYYSEAYNFIYEGFPVQNPVDEFSSYAFNAQFMIDIVGIRFTGDFPRLKKEKQLLTQNEAGGHLTAGRRFFGKKNRLGDPSSPLGGPDDVSAPLPLPRGKHGEQTQCKNVLNLVRSFFCTVGRRNKEQTTRIKRFVVS